MALVAAAFDRSTEGIHQAAGSQIGLDALDRMGAAYKEMPTDQTSLLLQLQAYTACGDPEVRDAARRSFGRMWQTVAEATGLDPVTIKAFLAFGMLLNSGAALHVAGLGDPWARGMRTRIRPGLFEHITAATNR